jgi:hypothetical protein
LFFAKEAFLRTAHAPQLEDQDPDHEPGYDADELERGEVLGEGETDQDYADDETVEDAVLFGEADAAAFAFFVDVRERDYA